MITPAQVRWLLVVLTVGSLLTSLALNADQYVNPYIGTDRYQKLVFAGKFIKDRGWSEPIYVSYGDPGVWFWSLDRSYIGIEAGLDYTYYGKLQDLYFLPPPLNESSYHVVPDTEFTTATRNTGELEARFGTDIGGIRDRPVVFLTPDSYNRMLSEWFASRYQVGNGVFVIPPGGLTELEINRWRLFAASDYVWKNDGAISTANWSLAPQILEVKTASANTRFAALYRFVTSLPVPFTIRVHVMDFPPTTGNGSVYAPLTFRLDGTPILNHSYGGSGPLWLSVTTGSLSSGTHILSVESGVPGRTPVLGIDVLEIQPA